MSRANYTAQQFIDAIPGSGGIISTIAARVGCSWHTAKKYIENYVTVKQAYEDEIQKPLDMAESILIKNLELAAKRQKNNEIVDATDAKWMLTMKGRYRKPEAAEVALSVIQASTTVTQEVYVFESRLEQLPPGNKDEFLSSLLRAERALNDVIDVEPIVSAGNGRLSTGNGSASEDVEDT